MEIDFEVSYCQTTLTVAHSLILLPEILDVELPAPSLAACLPAINHDFFAMIVID